MSCPRNAEIRLNQFNLFSDCVAGAESWRVVRRFGRFGRPPPRASCGVSRRQDPNAPVVAAPWSTRPEQPRRGSANHADIPCQRGETPFSPLEASPNSSFRLHGQATISARRICSPTGSVLMTLSAVPALQLPALGGTLLPVSPPGRDCSLKELQPPSLAVPARASHRWVPRS